MDRVVARIRRSCETGEPWEDTFPLLGKDGTYRWFLARALPIRDEHGAIVRWFGTNTDITELRRAGENCERLLAAEREATADAVAAARAHDALLATISHDLKNPPTAIHGFSQLLSRRIARGQTEAEMLAQPARQIEELARRMSSMLDELLDSARRRTGDLPALTRGPLDLVALARRVAETYARHIRAIRSRSRRTSRS